MARTPTPETKKSSFKLITNVSEFGLFQPLARSRTRLFISVLVANVLMFSFTMWVSGYINASSNSVSLNLVLIATCMFLLLTTSYIEAMLFGDLFFSGRWRERVLLGKKLDIDPESNEALTVGSYQSHNLTFLIVVAAAIIGNYFAFTAVNGDFLDDYHNIGFHLTRLRSDAPDEKVAALKELSKNIYRDAWTDPRVVPEISRHLETSHPEVQRWALWTAGSMSLTSGLDPIVNIARAETSTPESRADATVALGRIGDKRATPVLAELLKAAITANDSNQLIEVLKAIALLGDSELAPPVLELLRTTPQDASPVRLYAWWAIAQLRHTPAHDYAFETFKTAPVLEQCAALDALKLIPNQEDIRRFKDLFTLHPKDPDCPWTIWTDLREDKHYITRKETQRVKFMKIVHNASNLHNVPLDESWFQHIASDKDRTYEMRVAASDLIRLIKASKHR